METPVDLLKVLKALADETRLRMVFLLKERPLCVCEIAHLVAAGQPNVSKHLEKLQNAGLVTSEKKGQWVYYTLSAEALKARSFLQSLLKVECCVLPSCCADLKRLEKYLKNGASCKTIRRGEA